MRKLSAAGVALLLFTLVLPAQAREIEDMAGQKVTVPDHISRVFAMSHSFPLMVALAPDLLAGFASPVRPSDDVLRLLPPSIASLPQIGGGSDANLEKLKQVGVEVALGWTTPNEQYPVKQLGRIGVPVVFIDVDRLEQYPATFRFLGRLFQREERAEKLARAIEDALSRLRLAHRDGVPIRVYYAESMDGLTSQCDSSDRSEVITLAGAVNALHCDNPGNMAGNYPIDLESLLILDPDVIVTRYGKTAEAMRSDPRWQRLRAVKNGHVLSSPGLPFNWFDRPPSFMRAMGAQWLANRLDPARYPLDLRAETRRFDQLFFGVTPSEADLDKVLSP